MFTPPSKDGVWIFPGFDGGGEWGGAAVDPETAIMYVNSSELPWSLTMIDVPRKAASQSMKGIGQSVYTKYCVACHGPELKGNGASYPGLLNLEKKHTDKTLTDIIENGRNMMPAFKQISNSEKETLLAFLLNKEDKEPTSQNFGPVCRLRRSQSPLKKLFSMKCLIQ